MGVTSLKPPPATNEKKMSVTLPSLIILPDPYESDDTASDPDWIPIQETKLPEPTYWMRPIRRSEMHKLLNREATRANFEKSKQKKEIIILE